MKKKKTRIKDKTRKTGHNGKSVGKRTLQIRQRVRSKASRVGIAVSQVANSTAETPEEYGAEVTQRRINGVSRTMPYSAKQSLQRARRRLMQIIRKRKAKKLLTQAAESTPSAAEPIAPAYTPRPAGNAPEAVNTRNLSTASAASEVGTAENETKSQKRTKERKTDRTEKRERRRNRNRTGKSADSNAKKPAGSAFKRNRTKKQAAKQAGDSTKKSVKTIGKGIAKVGKTAASIISDVAVFIAGGGAVALIVIVLLCVVGVMVASPFGIFFASENKQPDTVPISIAVAQVMSDFNEQLEVLQDGNYDEIVFSGDLADWVDVISVFAVKTAGSNDVDASDVATLDAKRIDKLKNVFWDMNSLSAHSETIVHPDSNPDDDIDDSWAESILTISVASKSAIEVSNQYGFSDSQDQMLNELLEQRDALKELVGETRFLSAEAQAILNNLPKELSEERKAVVKAACSLVGKVNYFWGGKSQVIGWDSSWGTIRKVWAADSSTTGTYRPYGLDCSGFVDWVFWNASNGEYLISHGGGASLQHNYCEAISWEQAQPGDLVFQDNDDHVGIVVGRDENGELVIIHCAAGQNTVCITHAFFFNEAGAPLLFKR